MQVMDACDQDIDFIAAVCRDAKILYDSIMEGAFERQAKKYEENGLPSHYKMQIVYSDANKIGFVASKLLEEKALYLVGLYLLNEYQRTGFGSQVMDYIKSEAIKKDINRVVLLVHNRAEWAIDFYLKNGFRIVGKTMEECLLYQRDIKDYYIKDTYLMSYEFGNVS